MFYRMMMEKEGPGAWDEDMEGSALFCADSHGSARCFVATVLIGMNRTFQRLGSQQSIRATKLVCILEAPRFQVVEEEVELGDLVPFPDFRRRLSALKTYYPRRKLSETEQILHRRKKRPYRFPRQSIDGIFTSFVVLPQQKLLAA